MFSKPKAELEHEDILSSRGEFYESQGICPGPDTALNVSSPTKSDMPQQPSLTVSVFD